MLQIAEVRRFLSMLAIVLLLVLSACAGASLPATTPSGSAQDVAEHVIQVTPQTVRIIVGQTLVATSAQMRWMVSFDDNVLTLVSPTRSDENRGATEWRFRGRTAGSTDLTFTGDVTVPCATPPNCPPPAPPTVVVHVHVSPQENHD
jgi:hypothetical protein